MTITPKYRHLILLPFLFLLVISIIFLCAHPSFPFHITPSKQYHTTFPTNKSSSLSSRSSSLCLLIGSNTELSDLWQFNSRSACLSSVCLGNNSVAFEQSSTDCLVTTPSLNPLNHSFPAHISYSNQSCQSFQHQFVYCAHGTGMQDNQPKCPKITPIFENVKWKDDVWIVVPDYPWQMNIFHFSSTATDITRIISSLSNLRLLWRQYGEIIIENQLSNVHVLFRGNKLSNWFGWQNAFLNDIIVRHNIEHGINVSLHYMPEMTTPVCLRKAVILGKKGHLNMWPFLNITEVPSDGLSVPKEAIQFKKGVFELYNITTSLPHRLSRRLIFETPSFLVGYAKREGKPDEEGFYRLGASRRFGEEDEKWFEKMLQNETRNAGAEFVSFSFVHGETLEEQVRLMANVGFLVGIHGANLVNAMFMKPFGAFMEIFPYHGEQSLSRCYIGGGNAGLKYLRLEMRNGASAEESGCEKTDEYCNEIRQRRVVIGDDRDRIRKMVREGISHVRELRKRYPGGVPVHFNESTENYEIEE